MMFSIAALVLLLFSYIHPIVAHHKLNARTDCSKSYTICSPKGASSQDEPPVGNALASFFVDIVNTVDSNHNYKRGAHEDGVTIGPRATTGSLCCKKLPVRRCLLIYTDPISGADGTQCLLLQDYNLPFCYVSNSSGIDDLCPALIRSGQLHDQLLPSRRFVRADSLGQLHVFRWVYSKPHQRQLHWWRWSHGQRLRVAIFALQA